MELSDLRVARDDSHLIMCTRAGVDRYELIDCLTSNRFKRQLTATCGVLSANESLGNQLVAEEKAFHFSGTSESEMKDPQQLCDWLKIRAGVTVVMAAFWAMKAASHLLAVAIGTVNGDLLTSAFEAGTGLSIIRDYTNSGDFSAS